MFPATPGSRSIAACQALSHRAAKVVCGDLDEALVIVEDVLSSRANPSVIKTDPVVLVDSLEDANSHFFTREEELELAVEYLRDMAPSSTSQEGYLFFVSFMQKEAHHRGNIFWGKEPKVMASSSY